MENQGAGEKPGRKPCAPLEVSGPAPAGESYSRQTRANH